MVQRRVFQVQIGQQKQLSKPRAKKDILSCPEYFVQTGVWLITLKFKKTSLWFRTRGGAQGVDMYSIFLLYLHFLWSIFHFYFCYYLFLFLFNFYIIYFTFIIHLSFYLTLIYFIISFIYNQPISYSFCFFSKWHPGIRSWNPADRDWRLY